jgi:ribose-phosphate pyrophosphokinase
MKAIALIAGDAHPELAREIAQRARAEMIPAAITAFADGETQVRIEGDVRGTDLYIVQPTSAPTNERLRTLALLADAARAADAGRITAVIPYFGYARQDVRSRPGEARSAQVAARVLAVAGIDRVVALELHSPALESAFEMPLTHLRADALMLSVVRGWRLADPVVVSPDAGGVKRAQRYATALAAPLALIVKTRPRDDVAVPLQALGEVRGRVCLVVDDMASTGRTIAGAAQALLEAGAREVDALFVHAVMAPGALERIAAAGVRRIAATDSVPSARDLRLEIVPTASLFAIALTELAGEARSRRD